LKLNLPIVILKMSLNSNKFLLKDYLFAKEQEENGMIEYIH